MGSAGAQHSAAGAPQLERSISKVTAADTISMPVSDGAWETTVDFMDDDQARPPRPTPRGLLARDVFRRALQVIVILYEEFADTSGSAAARKIYKAAAQEYHGARFSPRFSPRAVLFGGAGCEAAICLVCAAEAGASMTFAVLDKGKCPAAAAGVTAFPSVCVRLGGEVRHHERSCPPPPHSA